MMQHQLLFVDMDIGYCFFYDGRMFEKNSESTAICLNTGKEFPFGYCVKVR